MSDQEQQTGGEREGSLEAKDGRIIYCVVGKFCSLAHGEVNRERRFTTRGVHFTCSFDFLDDLV